MDAVTELKRQAEANSSAVDAQYKPFVNQASIAHTNAQTTGLGFQNYRLADETQQIQDTRGLQRKVINGEVSWPQYYKAASVMSLNPIETINTITQNPMLYGKGNSFFPNQQSFNFAPPTPPPQHNAPAASPMFQLDPRKSPMQNGAAVRQQLSGMASQIYNYPNALGNSVTNSYRNLRDFGSGLSGVTPSTPSGSISPMQKFNQSFAPEYPVGF